MGVKCDGCPMLYYSEEFYDPHCTINDYLRDDNPGYTKPLEERVYEHKRTGRVMDGSIDIPWVRDDKKSEYERFNPRCEKCFLVSVKYTGVDGKEHEFVPVQV
jgi:hypothetical protein